VAVDEQSVSDNLYTAGLPDPDLIIRSGGQYRLSNFLIWQSAYSELYFTDCLWPEFGEEELAKALEFYSKTQRNFGK
jgi:undecaprenyl diphosphate synthase